MENEFDAIIIGSGTCGATIARELSYKKKKVLILERGANSPLKESFFGIASIADQVSLNGKVKAMRAITTGGSTALYFGVAMLPPIDTFKALGIDLSKELEEVQKEVPLAELPDELLGEQAKVLRDSALELGFDWKKNLMLIDQSKCTSGYSYEAKWKAKSFVDEAIQEGATLINQATVLKVIVENDKAIGVEYKLRKKGLKKAYGKKIILTAGSLESPLILRRSGLTDVANRGYYCDPAFAVYGIVPKLKGKDLFMGGMSTDYIDGVSLGDGNLTRTLFKMLMFSIFNFKLFFSYSKTIAIGVKLKDSLGGELDQKGKFNKQLAQEELDSLKKGEELANKILKNAGAKYIYTGKLVAANPGGVVRFKEHIDENMETKFSDLHVCDASIIPEDIRITPTLTLICLSKYLAKNLMNSL